jgi:hypothetical protein
MDLPTFRRQFKFQEEHVKHDTSITWTTEVVRRADNVVVDRVKTTLDVLEASDWIADSHTALSLDQWNWDRLIDNLRRGHLDSFAQRGPIDDWLPLNRDRNPDLEMYYQ